VAFFTGRLSTYKNPWRVLFRPSGFWGKVALGKSRAACGKQELFLAARLVLEIKHPFF